MSCHGCAQAFGFLKKEIGCPKCGFSYCKKCLRFKTIDPNTKKEILVCFRCNSLLTSKMDPEEPPVITKALMRLESLENPARPPITVYRQPARDVRMAQLKHGLSVEDQQLADRLNSLRKDEPESSSTTQGNQRRRSEQIEEEIKARLARLKDEDPSLQEMKSANTSSYQFKSKPETESDLIAKFSAEVKLDGHYETGFKGAVDDIESRLSKLRGGPQQELPTSSSASAAQAKGLEEVEELTEEEQIAKIIKQFKEEVELEAKNQESAPEVPEHTEDTHMCTDSEDEDDVDNLCRICDEKKATLKCKECDGDLFCKKCFQELHAELGEIHKSTAFKK